MKNQWLSGREKFIHSALLCGPDLFKTKAVCYISHAVRMGGCVYFKIINCLAISVEKMSAS